MKNIKGEKIYITALHLLNGGAEQAIINLANGLSDRGYEVTIWCIYNLGTPAYEIRPDIKIEYLTDCRPNREEFKEAVRLKKPLKILSEGIKALKTLCLKKKTIIDRIKGINDGVIISSRIEHNRYLAKYGRDCVLKIGQYHYGVEFTGRLLKDMKAVYKGLDYFVVLTDTLKCEAEEILSGTGCEAKAIANFLPEGVVRDLRSTSIENREKIIFSAGRLSYEKGYDRLVSAFKELKADDWRLVIAGDGKERDKLIKQSLECSNIEYLGMISHTEVLKYMKTASVYALPSRNEGFGYVLLEAQNAGAAVVSFDVRTGPRVIIENEKCGILVKDGDITGFTNAMKRLMEDENFRCGIAQNARESVKRFSENNVMDKWEELIK